MKNLVKKYFLFVAEKPIEKAIIIGSLLLIVAVLIITALYGKTEKALALDNTALYLTVLFAVLLSIVHFVITGLKVTSFYEDRERIILIYKDGEIEKYVKPIWGKYPYKIINLPAKWSIPMNNHEWYEFETTFQIRVNKQIATLVIKLNFLVYQGLSIKDLNTLIMRQDKTKENVRDYKFKECIEFIFNNHNLYLGNPVIIGTIISEWLPSNESRDELMEKIRRKITFPAIFFEDVKVIIDLLDVKLQLACCIDY